MSRRLLFLLIAVLLLRGWTGAAMAGQMLAQELQHAGTQVQAVHGSDCPGAVADAGGDASDTAAASTHCQDCTLHALPAAPLPVAMRLPAASLAELLPAFASAERQLDDKPPIS
jgi:hypothetical protein